MVVTMKDVTTESKEKENMYIHRMHFVDWIGPEEIVIANRKERRYNGRKMFSIVHSIDEKTCACDENAEEMPSSIECFLYFIFCGEDQTPFLRSNRSRTPGRKCFA
jgi:hypothetical protein